MGAIVGVLISDGYRAKRERRTALKLFEELQKPGYGGGYTQLTDCIRAWHQDASSDAGQHVFVPLKFRWGEAFQFDWSEESLVVDGVYRRLQVAHTKLCASRPFLLAAYPSQSHEMLRRSPPCISGFWWRTVARDIRQHEDHCR